jgi:hypothetical protein
LFFCGNHILSFLFTAAERVQKNVPERRLMAGRKGKVIFITGRRALWTGLDFFTKNEKNATLSTPPVFFLPHLCWYHAQCAAKTTANHRPAHDGAKGLEPAADAIQFIFQKIKLSIQDAFVPAGTNRAEQAKSSTSFHPVPKTGSITLSVATEGKYATQ